MSVVKQALHLLSLSVIARCIFALALAAAVNIIYLIWKVLMLNISFFHRYVNVDFLRQELIIGLLIELIYVVGIVVLYVMRHQKAWFGILEVVALQIIALTLSYQGYTFGSVSVVTGMMLIGVSILGMAFLFSRLALYAAVITAVLVLTGTAYANVYGWLPYAPKFVQSDMFQSVDQASFLISNNILFSAPIFFGILFGADFLIQQLRNQERAFEALSKMDPLTQVYNRHMVYEYMQGHLLRHHVEPSGLAVLRGSDAIILLDLDFFKKINDRYGHLVGDQVLVRTAEVLKLNIRDRDVLARFGGEEFIILLPETPLAAAYQVAERCRQAIQALRIITEDGQSVSVTASFGVCFSQDRQHLDHYVNVADRALYQAKAQGRNCVVLSRTLDMDMSG
ncbi:MAG: GGDEF domain-containing protein [Pseudomonadota bacterium]|nr:GGDEF domain-containing protein [Pseudomonadota bacterium]